MGVWLQHHRLRHFTSLQRRQSLVHRHGPHHRFVQNILKPHRILDQIMFEKVERPFWRVHFAARVHRMVVLAENLPGYFVATVVLVHQPYNIVFDETVVLAELVVVQKSVHLHEAIVLGAGVPAAAI